MTRKKAGPRGTGLKILSKNALLDFFVERVALEEGIVLLLLDALGDGLLITLREIARRWLTFFAGFSAFQGDSFLHGFK